MSRILRFGVPTLGPIQMTTEKQPGFGEEQSKELAEDVGVLKHINTFAAKLHVLEEKRFTIDSMVLGDTDWMP